MCVRMCGCMPVWVAFIYIIDSFARAESYLVCSFLFSIFESCFDVCNMYADPPILSSLSETARHSIHYHRITDLFSLRSLTSYTIEHLTSYTIQRNFIYHSTFNFMHHSTFNFIHHSTFNFIHHSAFNLI